MDKLAQEPQKQKQWNWTEIIFHTLKEHPPQEVKKCHQKCHKIFQDCWKQILEKFLCIVILPNIRKNQGTILGKNWIIPAENVDNRSWSAAAGKTKRQMAKSREEPYRLKNLGNTSTVPMS